ncbi:MAG: DUF5011 domain-containing protein [Mogibacterium sp.]|nr:DUF5011 domain-containing protein [Mogibacterium sp.]MBR0469298.1 DUF5011 domain-containing protein [Mogibacterium sp.]
MSEGKHDLKTHQKAEEKPKKRRSPLKVLLALIALLIITLAGSVAYIYKTAADSLALSFTDEAPVLEFGEDYPALDFVADHTGDVAPETAALDTGELGEKTITYTVSKPVLKGLFTPSREFTLSYTVVDTVAPLEIWSGDGAVIERGAKFNIQNVIAYGDNADPVPQVKVDGEVDTGTLGSYPLHVTVTDSSGNSTEWDLTVEVADSLPYYEDDSPRTPFEDFISEYKGDGRSFGIDVSAWQDEIDFEAVRKAGCEFVIIRIGYSEDGSMTVDKRFKENIRKAKAAGLKIGVYMYSYDNTEEKVRSSAAQLVETLDGESLDLPVAFDWEDFGNFQTYEMSFADLNRLYDAFADELSKSGYDCMLYGSRNYLEKIWDDTDTRPVWLAHYTDKTDYEGTYMLWQASSTGRIDGINGDVDMDILYRE